MCIILATNDNDDVVHSDFYSNRIRIGECVCERVSRRIVLVTTITTTAIAAAPGSRAEKEIETN